MDNIKENGQLTKKERCELAKDLCRILDATPAYLFDSMMMVSDHEFHLDTVKVERFMKHRGHKIDTDESMADAINRIYGEKARSIMETLI